MKGEHHHSLDPKGRLNFPAKLREMLGESFVICKGLDGCLFVYPQEEWEKFEDKINALPLSKGRKLQRFFFAGAADAEPDKQGRVLIPQILRDHAGLDKDVVIIGASTRAEIWNEERWAANQEENTEESIEETMDEIGF